MGGSRDLFEYRYFDDPVEPKRPISGIFSKVFSFAAIGALVVVGSTLAASVNLNSGQNGEAG